MLYRTFQINQKIELIRNSKFFFSYFIYFFPSSNFVKKCDQFYMKSRTAVIQIKYLMNEKRDKFFIPSKIFNQDNEIFVVYLDINFILISISYRLNFILIRSRRKAFHSELPWNFFLFHSTKSPSWSFNRFIYC